jgi:dipeptidyl aminopeptidase/acylaminoacyl peptidase
MTQHNPEGRAGPYIAKGASKAIWWLALSGVAVSMTAVTRLWSQEAPKPLSIHQLLAAPALGAVNGPAVSPDSSLLAYTVIDNGRKPTFDQAQSYRSGVPWYALGSDVWLSSLTGEAVRNLTQGRDNNWAPSWSPDGRRLAFLSDRARGASAGHTNVWIWDRQSATLRQASELPVMDPWGGLGQLEWLPDNRTVLVKTYPDGVSPGAYVDFVTGRSSRARSSLPTSVTVQVFRFDPAVQDSVPPVGPNNLTALLGELALVNVETGTVRRISCSGRHASYALSPDGRTLAWTIATGYERPGSSQILADVMVSDLGTRRCRRLVKAAPLAYGYPNFPLFSWSPTSRAIAFRTNGVGTPDEVFVAALEGGTAKRIASGPQFDRARQGEPPLWDREGQHLFFERSGALWRAAADGTGSALLAAAPGRQLELVHHRAGMLWSPDGGRNTIVFTMNHSTKRSGIARVNLTSGAVTQLLEEDRWYNAVARAPVVTPDGSAVLYVAEDATVPSNLWLAQADSETRPRQVTRVAGDLGRLDGGVAKVIEWRSLDGDTLRGGLIYPAGYRPGIRYPLIVKIYGGTDVSDDLNRFGFANAPVENLQVFTTRGYAVLLADSRARIGTPMLDLLKTVMPGVDRAVEVGVADPARIGIMGHSYGGYGALALIAQSRLFRAAVVRAGIGDLIGAYGQLSPDGTNYLLAWAERGQGRTGGTPWEVRDRYIENSPFFYLDRVETPLLLVHGTADRVPFLADQVFSALRRLGKRVEYARYTGEGHTEDLWSRPNQIDYLTRVLGWFDRYLKGEESAPQLGRTHP